MMYSLQTTTFNQWALDHGAVRVFDGLGMLVEQAAEAFFSCGGGAYARKPRPSSRN